MAKKYAVSDEAVAQVLEEIAEQKDRQPMTTAGATERGLSPAKLGVKDFVSAYQKGRKYLVMAGTVLSMFQPKAAVFIAQVIAFLDKMTEPAPEEA